MPKVAALQPDRVLYIACGPATLARDAGILVHEYGYRLRAAGLWICFRIRPTSKASRYSNELKETRRNQSVFP
ncbi:hypothetical protein [Alkalilimnicola ehrlichii]|uniref:hypothetical protein n=1 Tax=Alkalilimnicola ehrlichii TaxID=351052 RepID=UPI002868980B|nr:hypothetical protein [Alkalilimnicola ehrlichii]